MYLNTLLFLLFLIPSIIRAADDINFDPDKDIDTILSEIDPEPTEPTIKIPEEQIDDLTFWQKTFGSRSRDPLFLIPRRRLIFANDGVSANFFYNTSSELSICPNMVFKLESLEGLYDLAGGSPVSPSDEQLGSFDVLFKTLPYIRKMIVEERRPGCLLSGGFSKGDFSFQLDVPVLISERNYWLVNKTDRNWLKQLLEKVKGVGKSGAVKITSGIGDTKFRAAYNVVKSPEMKSAIGAAVIFPSSALFHRSQRESDLIKSKVGDPRDQLVNDLLNVAQSILIDPKLGSGSCGLGGFWDFSFTLNSKVGLWGRFSFDYLFPHHEHRFFPSTKQVSVNDFILLALSDEGIPADFPISSLFPTLRRVGVSPGNITNFTVGTDFFISKSWKLYGGYDFYYQGSEEISRIIGETIDSSIFSIQNALSPALIQHKVFGGIDYTKIGKKRDWIFGLGGDYSIANTGVAADWTIFGKVGITF